jgi:hypothetical protein
VSANAILADMPTDVKCVMSDFTDTVTHNNTLPTSCYSK